jgi:hypothetical protein
VYGLFSNVAEWTMTRPSSELKVARNRPGRLEDPFRVVRGGALAAAQGTPQLNATLYRWGSSLRTLLNGDGVFDGRLGFRAARSARPRYLAPQR